MIENIDFTKYKRFFAFGCSFTQYMWPTWADLVSLEIPESYNYGKIGAGNAYMFHTLVEAHTRYNFTTGDLIIIQWTNFSREDRYVNSKWLTPGNIYSQSTYPTDFVKKFSDDTGYLLRDLSYISATKHLLDKFECDYDFLSMVPIYQSNQYHKNTDDEARPILKFYANTVASIRPSFYETIFNFDWFLPPTVRVQDPDSGAIRVDPHPTPSRHLHYLTHTYPNIRFSKNTIDFATRETSKLLRSVVTNETYHFMSNPVIRF